MPNDSRPGTMTNDTIWHSVNAVSTTADRAVEITDIETIRISGTKQWGLVRIETDSNHVGIGETFPSDTSVAMVKEYGSRLVGENPADVSRLIDSLPASGLTEMSATAGLEMALWDLKGKILQAPVYELFGGAYRDRVRIYADLHAGVPVNLAPEHHPESVYAPEAYATAASEAVADGFDILKFDIDVPRRRGEDTVARWLGTAGIERRVDRVAAVRDAVGTDADIGVDLHRGFTTESAVRLGDALEPYDLAFIEDPVPPNRIAAHERIARDLTTPVLTGEALAGPDQFDRFVSRDALDIAAPDIANCGGLQSLYDIAAFCDRAGVPIVPHNNSSPVGTVAAAHVGAAVPNFVALEFHGIGIDWWADVVRCTAESDPLVSDGYLRVPQGPGLGIELDQDVLDEQRV